MYGIKPPLVRVVLNSYFQLGNDAHEERQEESDLEFKNGIN
jgi:hypothetical protein